MANMFIGRLGLTSLLLAAALSVAGQGRPDSSSAAEVSSGASTRIILLGTAGGPPIRRLRSEPASLLVVGGRPYLIDAGAGVVHQLAWAGFRPVDLSAVFITHQHLDHNADVGSLLAFNWVEGRKTAMPVVGPWGTVDLVKAGLAYFAASERTYGGESPGRRPSAASLVAPKDVTGPGLVYQDDRVKVTAAENTHYQTFPHGNDRSFSYRFDTADRSVVFTGDTGPSAELVKLAANADVLVTEVIDVLPAIALASGDVGVKPDLKSPLAEHMRSEHLSPEVIGRMAAEAHVKMVVLTHFAPGLDTETDVTRYTDGVRKYFKGPVIAGRDLLEL